MLSRAGSGRFLVACVMVKTRAATPQDLPALTEVYNHYIVHTPITFDLRTVTPEEGRPWFDRRRD